MSDRQSLFLDDYHPFIANHDFSSSFASSHDPAHLFTLEDEPNDRDQLETNLFSRSRFSRVICDMISNYDTEDIAPRNVRVEPIGEPIGVQPMLNMQAERTNVFPGMSIEPNTEAINRNRNPNTNASSMMDMGHLRLNMEAINRNPNTNATNMMNMGYPRLNMQTMTNAPPTLNTEAINRNPNTNTTNMMNMGYPRLNMQTITNAPPRLNTQTINRNPNTNATKMMNMGHPRLNMQTMINEPPRLNTQAINRNPNTNPTNMMNMGYPRLNMQTITNAPPRLNTQAINRNPMDRGHQRLNMPPREMGNNDPPRLTAMQVRVQNRYSRLTSKQIQKAAYNFGHAAIGNYMKKKVRDGYYNRFMSVDLRKDEDFIKSLRQCTISYHLKSDFKRVWMCDEFLNDEPANLENNQNVALKRITEKFLREDALNWINHKVRREDYRALYVDILQAYRRGINNLEEFSLTAFTSSTR